MNICVSVIVPIYNMEQYLPECLDSIIAQTLREIEIICINDGSTDQSLEILKKYAKSDLRIIILDQKNKGVAEARNAGIRTANGEYVIFMDPDDWYPNSNILQILYQKASRNGAFICGGEFSDYNEITKEVRTSFPEQYYGYTFEKEEMVNYRDYQYDFGYHRFLFQRKFLMENGIFFPRLIRFQDPPFMVKAMILAKQFYAVKMVVYRYRYGHSGNMWNSQKVGDLLDGIYLNLEMAVRYDLQKLMEITWYRMNIEFGDLIFDELVNENKEITRKVKRIYDKLPDQYRCITEFPFLERLQKRQMELLSVISSQEQLLQELKEEVRCGKEELERIKKTKAFRIGKTVLYLPGKVYWWIRGKI